MNKKLLIIILVICLTLGGGGTIALLGIFGHSCSYTEQITSEQYLKQAATCTEKAVYYFSCSCGKMGTQTFEYGSALGHSYGMTEYSFDEESKTFTAVRYCIIDNHEDTETVEAEYVKDTDATCVEAETGHYEATFENWAFVAQSTGISSVINGTMLDHSYGTVQYNWSGNECEASQACTRTGCTHSENEYSTGTYVKDTDATCIAAETGHYEATFKNVAFTKQSTKKDSVTKGTSLGHSYGTTQYNWSGNECEASRVCIRTGCTHSESEHSTGAYVKDTDATCIAAETGHYEATFENSAFKKQSTEKDSVTNGTMLGHNFNKPTYTWNGDMCTATRTCARCRTKTETETVKGTFVQDLGATCGEAAKGHYLAIFENSNFSQQETQGSSISYGDPLPHDFGTVTYSWNDGYCTAKRVCQTDGTHIDEETVLGDYIVDSYVNCTEAETGHKEARFKNTAFEMQKTTTYSIGEPLGHDYNSPNYEWDGNKCTAQRICKRNSEHIETETATGIYVKDTDVTCVAAETGHYEATFVSNVFETQQTTKDSVTNGEPRGHNFNVQNTDEKYIKDIANCQNKAVYWYSCSCGETGTTTFTYGDIGDHIYEKGICKICSAKKISVGLTYTLNDDEKSYAVALGTCTDTEVVIPDTYNDLPVTTIAQKGFYYKDITSIILPNSLTTILDNAFSGCQKLESITTIPNSVTTILDNAFSVCKKLESITIPNSVTTIGKGMFKDCANLQSAVLGSGMTEIAESMFDYCYNLTDVTIPNSVTSIAKSAFSNCWKLNLQIPEQIKFIGQLAFYACHAMENLVIPANVTTIKDRAFEHSGVKTVIMNNTMEKLGNIFNNAKSLVSVKFPSGLLELNYTFSSCTSLEYVELPETLKKIFGAFNGCTSLKSIVLPASVENIQVEAFKDCSSLENITLSENILTFGDFAFYGCTALKNITLPSSLLSISSYAFYGCTSLTSIIIPAKVEKISDNVFVNCTNLVSIEFEEQASWCISQSYNRLDGDTPIDISDATQNATYFKSTYAKWYWFKQENYA